MSEKTTKALFHMYVNKSLPSDISCMLFVYISSGYELADACFPCVIQYSQMKSLLEKTKKTQTTMTQKVQDALHQRDDMRTQMEEAFTAKEAVSTMTNLFT